MRYIVFTCLFLSACVFHPMYTNQVRENVCVEPIANESGYQLYQHLQRYFPGNGECLYTLVVNTPQHTYSDQSISDKDFITMQSINASTSYTLKDKNKKVILKKNVRVNGSSAITSNPYSSVVGTQKTSDDLNIILADQIILHVSAFLDEANQ